VYAILTAVVKTMAELKTKLNEVSVADFLAKTDDDPLKDCYTLISLMEKVTGEKAKMWGPAIVGFGQHHYKYASGREGDICKIGFSPRKGNLSLYVLAGAEGQSELLAGLGKHKAGKGCLYIKKLADVNVDVLEQIMRNALKWLDNKIPA
jgi:hypothetical protein